MRAPYHALFATNLPPLGLDLDGTIVIIFTADRCGADGGLTVLGDSTYAAYVERDGLSHGAGDGLVGRPPPDASLSLCRG
jgi:hypothetical protein